MIRSTVFGMNNLATLYRSQFFGNVSNGQQLHISTHHTVFTKSIEKTPLFDNSVKIGPSLGH